MKKKYKKLLFDLDNTLVDDDENRRYAIKKILEERKEKVNTNDIEDFLNIDNKFWRDRAAGLIKDPYEFKDQQEKTDWVRAQRFIIFFKDISLQEGIEINNKYIEYLNDNIVPMKNADKVLDTLYNKGYELYIITNSPVKAINNKLTKSGLKKYITDVFSAEEAGHMKPHTDFYNNIYSKIGNDGDMLIVGDELGCDIALGINNNIDTCWFNNNSSENNTLYKPNFMIKDLIELTDIIE